MRRDDRFPAFVVFLAGLMVAAIIWLFSSCTAAKSALSTLEVGASTTDGDGFATQNPARGAQFSSDTLWASIRPLAGLELELDRRADRRHEDPLPVHVDNAESLVLPEGEEGEENGDGIEWGTFSISLAGITAILTALGGGMIYVRKKRAAQAD